MSGTAGNLPGNMQEDFGRLIAGAKAREPGRIGQVEGSIQELYGRAVDSTADAIGAVRQMPACVARMIRHRIESNPYKTAAIALGLAWLIGRSRRPF
jgi:uncharacterized protein YjbJ (UPF0337 family)